MPITSGMTIPRGDLGAAVMAAENQDFIAELVFPPTPVPLNQGGFGVIPAEIKKRRFNTKRAAGGAYTRITHRVTQDTYATREYGLEMPLDDRQKNIFANFVDFERSRAELIDQGLKIDAELEVATALESETTWPLSGSTGYNASTAWSNAGATIIADIATSQKAARGALGMVLDTLIISWDVWWNMSINTGIRAAIGNDTNKDTLIPLDTLARLLNLKRIIVATAMYNTADDGQTASYSNCWSNNYAHLCKIAETQNIEEPCIGRCLHWNGDGGGTPQNATFEEYVEDPSRGSVLRGRAEAQYKTILSGCHFLISID